MAIPWTSACYREAQLPEYKGNPLIEALPAIQPDHALHEFFSKGLVSSEIDRQRPAYLRRKMVDRTHGLLFPLPEYVDVFRSIEDALFDGYVSKNPLTPTGQHYLHYLKTDDTPTSPATGVFRPNACGLSIFGESGAGKTAGIDRALEWFPQVIVHETYLGRPFPVTQVPWLKIQCPSSATPWGFVLFILDELDRIFGTNEVGGAGPRPKNIDQAGILIERRLRSLHVGILILDELQNLLVGSSDLRHRLQNIFLHLINRSGIPILFCGNEDTKGLLKETLRNARRAEDGGSIDMGPIDPCIWPSFAESLWRIQYTDDNTPLTDDLASLLYRLSRGIPGFAVNIYRRAQKLVIGSGDEKLTPEVLQEARFAACALSGDILDSIELPGSRKAVSDQEDTGANRQKSKTDSDTETVDPGIAAANRTQHPEFESRIALTRKNRFALPLDVDSDILRRASDSANPYKELLASDQVLSDLFSFVDLPTPH